MTKKPNTPKLLKTISDLFIRYLFSSNGCEPITRSFINAVMTDANLPPIVSVNVKSPFNLESYLEEKESILDVLVEDETKQTFHIEVQVLSEDAFIERCLYYNSKIYSTQLTKGESYADLKPVISIVLTAHDLFPNADHCHLSFMMMSREIPGLILSEQKQIHFLQLPKWSNGIKEGEVSSPLLDWLKFFNYPNGTDEDEFQSLGKEDEGLKMAIQAFETFQNDPVLRDIAERREKFLLDVSSAKQTYIRRAKDKAKAEGIAIGEARGESRGIAIGEARGKSRGKTEGKIEMLIFILTKRLGPLPEDLKVKLSALTDLSQIDQLSDIALDVPTFEDFAKRF